MHLFLRFVGSIGHRATARGTYRGDYSERRTCARPSSPDRAGPHRRRALAIRYKALPRHFSELETGNEVLSVIAPLQALDAAQRHDC
jgi:hypothetical protein